MTRAGWLLTVVLLVCIVVSAFTAGVTLAFGLVHGNVIALVLAGVETTMAMVGIFMRRLTRDVFRAMPVDVTVAVNDEAGS